MKKIFLISGFAQHGKDSTANFLKQKLLGKSLIIHNADYLKFICKEYLEWDGSKDEYGRTLLQKTGTENTKIKLNKPFFWIEKVCDVIEITQDLYDYYMIPDIRFKSEIYYPLARFPDNVITIRIHRLNFDNGLNEEQKNHISEIELKNFKHDIDVYSKSGLNNLESEVNMLVKNLKEKGLIN
jgi:hypothetical protein